MTTLGLVRQGPIETRRCLGRRPCAYQVVRRASPATPAHLAEHQALLVGRGGLQVQQAAQQRLHLGAPLALGLDLRGGGGGA